ncbi:TRAFAC clade GTPase domain-containing protein [Dactylosporangium sp. CA-092794]|uniref:TRAFAC clade GTPase domain-containing protein n=1 Tax=Dactylosporangium sp. CA-092794 TaxID=3239929 RepID=UPI003D8A1745
MNVLLIGPSGVGRTTFLCLALAALGDHRFPVRVTAARSETGRWVRYVTREIRERGTYPARGGPDVVLDLLLTADNAGRWRFRCQDFSGAVLREPGTAQAASFDRALASADGLLLFADATELLDARRTPRNINDIVAALLRAATYRAGRPTAAAVVVTKTDAVDLTRPQVTAQLLEPFRSLVASARRDPSIQLRTSFAAVGPQPVGFAGPLLWVLTLGLLSRARELSRALRVPAAAPPYHAARQAEWAELIALNELQPLLVERLVELADEHPLIRAVHTHATTIRSPL